MLFTAELDNRSKVGNISSRIGLSEKASTFNNDDNLFSSVEERLSTDKISCVFVDEAQFLTDKQVWELSDVVEILNIPVMCFGLRTDFQGKLFEGSQELLALADNLKELKTICSLCDKKATMVVRLNEKGEVVLKGKKIVVGGNEIYKTLCRKHFRELTKLI